MKREIEFQKMKDDLAYIKKVLTGNGENGLIKQMRKVRESVIKIESMHNFRIWILYGAVTLLFGICMFMLRHISYGSFR
jgi:hypothetical protein